MKKESNGNLAVRKAELLLRSFLRDNDIDVRESFHLEINSDGELNVKGTEDVSAYTETEILLVCREFFVEIKGNGLKFRAYSKNSTGISGEISSISFMKR